MNIRITPQKDSIENDGYQIIVNGNFYCDSHPAKPEEILSVYKSHGEKTADHLDGCGFVAVNDKVKGKFFVFTDFLGSSQYIFYRADSDNLFITTDLISITRETDIIDKRAAEQFFRRGCVYGPKTLIKGIFKVVPGCYLEVDTKSSAIRQRKSNFTFTKNPVTPEIYDSTFGDIISECYESGMGSTLSGGYDSNFILHHALKHLQPSEKIEAFCIGGISGADETGVAREIADYYGNVNLNIGYVGPETFSHLPEIVRALQGQVFERGIFLQYELCKTLAAHNIKRVLLGECADQLLNYDCYHPHSFTLIKSKTKIWLCNTISRLLHGTYLAAQESPYEYAAYRILKKNGMMMNHFGLSPEYPYVRRKFINVAYDAAIPGDGYKTYHKKTVSSILPAEIAAKISKKGGTTDTSTLFSDGYSLYEKVKGLEFFSEKKYSRTDEQQEYWIRVLYLNIFSCIFIKGMSDEETAKLFSI